MLTQHSSGPPRYGARLGDEVMQVEELHVAGEVFEQVEEGGVTFENLAQRVRLLVVDACVVQPDALQRQVETARDPRSVGLCESGSFPAGVSCPKSKATSMSVRAVIAPG